jgi:hypothetical protein
MSLDNVQLPPLIIQQLYEKTLIGKAETFEQPNISSGVLNFLGGNASNIILLVKNEEVTYLTDTQLKFLTGILNACKLNLNNIAALNIHQNKRLTYKKLSTDLNAKVVLLFGVTSQEIDLPFTIPEFQIQSFNNQKYICTPGLDILEKDVELKKKLWTSLKQIFL